MASQPSGDKRVSKYFYWKTKSEEKLILLIE
jgi:hypothetical protein